MSIKSQRLNRSLRIPMLHIIRIINHTLWLILIMPLVRTRIIHTYQRPNTRTRITHHVRTMRLHMPIRLLTTWTLQIMTGWIKPFKQ
jgi:hypothetical protein